MLLSGFPVSGFEIWLKVDQEENSYIVFYKTYKNIDQFSIE